MKLKNWTVPILRSNPDLFSKSTDLRSKWSWLGVARDVGAKQRWCFQWCENLYGISCSSQESLGGLTALTLSMPEMWYSEDGVKLSCNTFQNENDRKKGPLFPFFYFHEKCTIPIMCLNVKAQKSQKISKNCWARGNRKILKWPKMVPNINLTNLKLKSHE